MNDVSKELLNNLLSSCFKTYRNIGDLKDVEETFLGLVKKLYKKNEIKINDIIEFCKEKDIIYTSSKFNSLESYLNDKGTIMRSRDNDRSRQNYGGCYNNRNDDYHGDNNRSYC